MSTRRISPLFVLLLLAACHGDSNKGAESNASSRPKGTTPLRRGPTQEELTAGMVEAVTLGKSTVPVDVKFDLAERPAVGQSLDIVIALVPKVAGSAAVAVSGSDGLQLVPGSGKIDIPAIEPTQAYRMTITVTPTAEGVQLLGLNVTLTHDSMTESRSFSVPVIVATGDAAASTVGGSGRQW